MRTYDPKLVHFIVNGMAITGYADGTFISAEKTEDTFTEYVGALGEVSVAENANETGEITVTLANTSPSIAYLNRLANAKGENAEVAANIIDMNTSGVNAGGTKCRVRKPNGASYGKEVGNVEFNIFVADFSME